MTSTNLTARASARTAVLASMGATGTMFRWPTATAQLDLDRGRVAIVTDLEPSPEDWESVCGLLELSGYRNGTDGPFTADPGEPAEIMGLSTWSLELARTAVTGGLN